MHGRNFGLDILRASAICLVIASHYFKSYAAIGGLLGVELFFSLSGFLIGRILIRDLRPAKLGASLSVLKRFWLSRWFRTLPNYYVFYFLYLLGGSGAVVGLGKLLSYLPFLQNFSHPIPDFFGVSWSLAVEEWFYLTFPIALTAFGQIFTNWRKAFLTSAALFIVIPLAYRWLFMRAHGSLMWDENIRKVVVARMDATMFGVLAAGISISNPDLWRYMRRPIFPIIGSAMILIACFLLLFHPSPIFVALSFTTLPLGWALWIAPMHERALSSHTILSFVRSAITTVSLLSYSLYLCHMMVFETLAILLHDSSAGSIEKMRNRCIMLLATFLFSAVTYRWIEKPFLALRDRALRPSRTQIAGHTPPC